MKQLAIFAGGCFWCMVKPFAKYDGVTEVISGYTGGWKTNPSYEEVCSGKTGHYEAVQITFDPNIIGYSNLLEIFFRQIDPTDGGGQFNDRGERYQPAIFYTSIEQKLAAESALAALASSGKFSEPLAVAIFPATTFYPAEEYHQDFYQKNPEYYQGYHRASGRAGFLERVWQKSQPDLSHLSPLQLQVTQHNATEPPFDNQYWNHTERGLYVDVVDGTPLFLSDDKFDAGCGWPSFTRPINLEAIMEKRDLSHRMVRIEVRSRDSNAHLGHLFDDGPQALGGQRYCINSASLRFIPYERLAFEGYKEYQALFKKEG